MSEPFARMLAEGGKKNSLGRAGEVVQIVVNDQSRLNELYDCLFEPDAWLRMRAIDSLEKVCRVHPEWVKPYTERFFEELASSDQASIQWHLAEMFGEIELSTAQKKKAISWLVEQLRRENVDWIVAANTMKTLAQFVHAGTFSKNEFVPLLERQLNHRSNAVVKRATKLLAEFSK